MWFQSQPLFRFSVLPVHPAHPAAPLLGRRRESDPVNSPRRVLLFQPIQQVILTRSDGHGEKDVPGGEQDFPADPRASLTPAPLSRDWLTNQGSIGQAGGVNRAPLVTAGVDHVADRSAVPRAIQGYVQVYRPQSAKALAPATDSRTFV